MKFFLTDNKSIARALMAGFIVWCVSTGEGFSARPSSFNRAKAFARYLVQDEERKGWYINWRK